ncbi:splicing factor Cactin-like [Clavelina lepadiformis]|uniref:Splicing factor Cactin n=1 Tax=Clavelina lepadiformis TaxID=159417 RepID=A0ABP0GD76_CLALP
MGRKSEIKYDESYSGKSHKKKKSKHKDEKSKQKKHRHRSSSFDRSSSDDENHKSRLEKERARILLEKQQQKEIMKALETPEEKRRRRLAKKEEKERKKREKMGWDQEYMGYTNTDNPFGDGKLLDTFVWHKKLEKEGLQDLAASQKKDLIRRKQDSNKIELEKVKQQRLERERERQLRDEEVELMQREKEAEHFKAWEDQEDKFHLEQAKLRSRIRIQDGRAKPIDLLAKYASSAEDGAEDLSGVEMHEPYTYLNGLTMTDLEDLLEDIKVYMELEQGKNVEFWKDMTVVTEDELQTLKKIMAEGDGSTTRDTRREGINKAVNSDVAALFRSKTHTQLLALKNSISAKIETGGSSLDVGYWESLLSQLKAYLAKARLRDRHQQLLKSKLYSLKLEQLGEEASSSQPSFPVLPQDKDNIGSSSNATPSVKQEQVDEDLTEGDEATVENNEAAQSELTEEDLQEKLMNEYVEGSYSPRLLHGKDLPPDAVIIDAEEDALTVEGKRKLLTRTGDAGTGQEDAFVRIAQEGMDKQEEATFAVEAPIAQQVFLWADKYRPRKPRFFNRVHTGFEWNKYNQTHYDFDNPPPKVVQGYKFNIFYPDLINRSEPPTYSITPDGDSTDFAILKFSAGPPYQDLAFKIVNREWEYSHKHGFRCQFINSIFQLWFHFKRYRYRR